MKVRIEIDEQKLKELVHDYLRDKLGDVNLAVENIVIEVKSKQNYKSEWESANFRAIFEDYNF